MSLHVFTVSVWVTYCRYFGFLPWSKDIRDDSKFVAVNVSMNGGLSLCVRPAIDWQPLQGVVCSFPYDYWDRLHPSHDPDVDKKMEVFCGIL